MNGLEASGKPIIALDGDGVLLDYNLAYATAWARYAGAHPTERDPHAYWHTDRWDVQRLTGERLAEFRAFFDAEFWASIPPIAGAVAACQRLHDQGHALVCVTALDENFAGARLRNLRAHGFPIERVYATGNQLGQQSPKAQVMDEIRPVAFVDDFLPYLAGIRGETHTALILREPNGSPNVGPGLAAVGSRHADLAAFRAWWLARI
ncbi:MAG: HAD family hydrolase [Burkholderiaceae bacterium]|nr:HAD family hydrolase [Burkholderiaceae bacterium]